MSGRASSVGCRQARGHRVSRVSFGISAPPNFFLSLHNLCPENIILKTYNKNKDLAYFTPQTIKHGYGILETMPKRRCTVEIQNILKMLLR